MSKPCACILISREHHMLPSLSGRKRRGEQGHLLTKGGGGKWMGPLLASTVQSLLNWWASSCQHGAVAPTIRNRMGSTVIVLQGHMWVTEQEVQIQNDKTLKWELRPMLLGWLLSRMGCSSKGKGRYSGLLQIPTLQLTVRLFKGCLCLNKVSEPFHIGVKTLVFSGCSLLPQ